MKAPKQEHRVRVWSCRNILLESYLYAPGPAGVLPRRSHEDYQFCLSLDFPGEYRYETNTFGAWRTCGALAPMLRRSGRARIVNVSSGAGSLASMGGGTPAYSVSKVALHALTRMLAAELRNAGVLVNAVDPGWTATDMGGHGGRPVEDGAAGVVWPPPSPTTVPRAASSTTESQKPGKQTLAKKEQELSETENSVKRLVDEAEIRGVVDGIDLATDIKDWELCRGYFTDEIFADFTSLAGGDPGRMPADALVDAWKTNLYADKLSHHMRTNHKISLRGDGAEVFSKGYALNILKRNTGSDLWEVWGDYTHTLERTPEGWRCSGMTFTVIHARGNEVARDG